MPEPTAITRLLVKHFFRRFFDNDTLQVQGDTLITVVRAACAVAVPGLMYAFFLQLAYPPRPPRPLWGRVQDEYFFILISFVVMGLVSVFEWEMLFPDRLDFLILTPLPLKTWQLLAAKASALLAFFVIFLFSSNVCGTSIFPLLLPGDPLPQMEAHAVAVLCAGAFAVFFFLALGGLLLCVLGAARFRVVSPVIQMLSVAALVLLLLSYVRYVDTLPTLLASPQGWVRCIPPFWFLGMYESLLRGQTAPAFAHPFTLLGLQAIAIAFGTVLVTYPLAWIRMRRLAMEGGTHQRANATPLLNRLLHRIVNNPNQRAVFHFIGQTMARNNRYQVYLAMYGGSGLALAIACAVTFRIHGDKLALALSGEGMHAIMPLLLFWVVAGLRTAFAFPLNLPASWVFRVAGADMVRCASAARAWALCCAVSLAAILAAVILSTDHDWRQLAVQAGTGVCLCVLLTDMIFFFQAGIPFTHPRMPGRTSLPLVLTLYIGVFPLFVYGVIFMETQMEKQLLKLLFLAAATALLHAGLIALSRELGESSEEVEGYEGEFQILGLN